MSKNPQIDPALDPQPVMTQYQAVGLAEGFIEGTEEEQVAAHGNIYMTPASPTDLQGWFGRTAQAMIQDGIINP